MDQDDLLDLLEDPSRRLPVIVVSARDRENPDLALNIEDLAAAVCGLAYVATILPETSWALTKKFGKKLSVFDRGIRIYMPGLDDGSDQFGHPLWLGARLQTDADAALADHQIRNRVAQFSTRMVRLGEDILPFAQLRGYARKTEQDRLTISGASDTEKLLAANNSIAALAKELGEAKDMEKYALDEERSAQRRLEEAEVRERNATARVQHLLQILADSGDADAGLPPHPGTWEDFEDWCDITLVGRVVLTGAARRGCKKALYGDAGQVAQCLLWLADECRQRFLEGGGPLRDATVEQGIKNSLCGSDEFTFDWQSQKLSANWHVKTGGNSRAPENCLRIYYAWDEQSQ